MVTWWGLGQKVPQWSPGAFMESEGQSPPEAKTKCEISGYNF